MFSLDSYRHVRATGGVVRRLDRGVLAVTGADRASWLQGLLTSDIAALREGQAQYSAYLTPQGRMIADLHVVAQADRVLLDVPTPIAGALVTRLDGLIFSEDASIADVSATHSVWTVVSVIDGAVAFRTVVDSTLPPSDAALPTIDMDTFEVVRIEEGVPRFLIDMTEETIPLEAGIEDRAISFTKGCYVGQEVIVRVMHRGGGRVAKKLVRWQAGEPTSAMPSAGASIFSVDAPAREIGRVTSAVFSSHFERSVGLGYVHRDFIASGTAIAIAAGDQRVAAVVA